MVIPSDGVNHQALRFLLVGGLNTCLTYLLYLGLALLVRADVAYAIAYAGGVLIAFFGHRRFVFGSQRTTSSAFPYAIMHVGLMLLGAFITYLSGRLGLPPWIAGLTAMVVMVPVSFVANRAFFRPSGSIPAMKKGE